MPIDFPSSPTSLQEYTFANKTWYWNGSAWQLKGTDLAAWSGSTSITTVGTLSTPVITGLKETKSVLAANNIDLTLGNYFTKTITGATTFTVTNTPSTGIVGSFILDLTNGGAFSITWWSGVKWASGTAPTLTSSGRDCLGFFTHDGGTIWAGLLLGKDIR